MAGIVPSFGEINGASGNGVINGGGVVNDVFRVGLGGVATITWNVVLVSGKSGDVIGDAKGVSPGIARFSPFRIVRSD